MPDRKRKPSFEELRRGRAAKRKRDRLPGAKLFETKWEVFVARYDKVSGRYVSQTLCCETAN